jgi:hypothetical protein
MSGPGLGLWGRINHKPHIPIIKTLRVPNPPAGDHTPVLENPSNASFRVKMPVAKKSSTYIHQRSLFMSMVFLGNSAI